MFDLFSDEAADAVALAREQAHRLGHQHVGTEHVLLGLLAGSGPAIDLLSSNGVFLDPARAKVAEAVGPVLTKDTPPAAELGFTPRAKRGLERASRFALQRGSKKVGTGHVLLGILDVEGTAAQILRRMGVDVPAFRREIDGERTPATHPAATPARKAAAGPSCATCNAELAHTISTKVLSARAGRRTVELSVVYCSACGAAISAAPVKP